jgi:hypothetical protein
VPFVESETIRYTFERGEMTLLFEREEVTLIFNFERREI